MNRQKIICLLLVLLSPILYSLCWWPMKFTGFMFWAEPNDIVKHIWKETSYIFTHPKQFRIKDWLWILFVLVIAHIPYFIMWQIIKCLWKNLL